MINRSDLLLHCVEPESTPQSRLSPSSLIDPVLVAEGVGDVVFGDSKWITIGLLLFSINIFELVVNWGLSAFVSAFVFSMHLLIFEDHLSCTLGLVAQAALISCFFNCFIA